VQDSVLSVPANDHIFPRVLCVVARTAALYAKREAELKAARTAV
jgi:hypothetical protein